LQKELSLQLEQTHKDRIRAEEERAGEQKQWEAEIRRIKLDSAELESRHGKERSESEAASKAKEEENSRIFSSFRHQFDLEVAKSKELRAALEEKDSSISTLETSLQDHQAKVTALSS
jgi:hypothetical protein